MVDAMSSISSLMPIQSIGGSSVESQIKGLNAQIVKLRAQMSEEITSKDEQKIKEAKLNLIQQQILSLETRISELHNQQSLNKTYAANVKSPVTINSANEYGHIDTYAFYTPSDTDD